MEPHGLHELVEASRLRPREGLGQRPRGLLHERNTHPLAVHFPDDGPVVRAVDGEFALRHPRVGPVGHCDPSLDHGTLLVAVEVVDAVVPLHDGLQELVDVVDAARGVHPAGPLVEALVDEELPPRDRAVGVEPLVADHVQLGPEEERRVGVDEEEGVARGAVGGGDGDAVGPGRLGQEELRQHGLRRTDLRRQVLGTAPVEGLERGRRGRPARCRRRCSPR